LVNFRSTIRSTNSFFLCVLQVLRQSSRTCKLLYSHGGSHRFESCSAHHPNQSLTGHLAVLRCSRLLQLLRYVPQIIVRSGNPIHPDRPGEGRDYAIATSERPWITGANRSHRRELSAPAAVAPAACACDGFWALLLIPRSSRFRAWLTSREWNWPSCSRLISTARAHQPQHPKPRSRMRLGHSMG